MGLLRKAGVKINSIFPTRLRHLIKMNLIPKSVAGLKCHRQELTSSGAQPVISVSVEVLLAGTPAITQQLPAAEISKS